MEHWHQELLARSVAVTPVMDVAQMFANEQVEARGMIVPVEHPVAGPVRLTAGSVRISATPVAGYRMPPPLGADTDAVLRGVLGRDETAIAALKASGVV